MNIDDLRSSTSNQNQDADAEDNFSFDDVVEEHHFLGMTAVERMFLAIFLFMNIVVLGIAVLLATHRLVF